MGTRSSSGSRRQSPKKTCSPVSCGQYLLAALALAAAITGVRRAEPAHQRAVLLHLASLRNCAPAKLPHALTTADLRNIERPSPQYSGRERRITTPLRNR